MDPAQHAEGNAAFKAGNYARAITLYTECIASQPANPKYYNNRALAHLKQQNYQQAEADCTQCLGLDGKNVKALWRRAISRKYQQKLLEAHSDIRLAATLEPFNKVIQEELQSIEALLIPPEQSEARRVAVETLDKEADVEGILERDYGVPPLAAARVATSVRPDLAATPAANLETTAPTPPATKTFTPPKDNLDFERQWRSYRNHPPDLYSYLKVIEPEHLPTLFRSTLDADRLMDVVHILSDFYTSNEPVELIYRVLQSVAHTQRFEMMLLFLGKVEKARMLQLFAKCQALAKDNLELQDKLRKLQTVYNVKA